MSRIIKFRAYDRIKHEMVQLTILGLQSDIFDDLTIYGVSNTKGNVAYSREDHVPVMQFSGLLDSKGKEIYEGDLVDTHNALLKDPVGKVIFNHGEFRIKFPGNSIIRRLANKHHIDQLEVVGNIYENEEKFYGSTDETIEDDYNPANREE